MEATVNNLLDFEIHILPQQGESYPIQVKLGDGGDFAGRLLTGDLLSWAATGEPEHDGQRLFNVLFADSTLRTAWDAARGPDGRIYPWGDGWDAGKCNSEEGGKLSTTPVGAYPQGASPYGVLDMAGNVWEWTYSRYKAYPYRADDGREDVKAVLIRVLRGGGVPQLSCLRPLCIP
jgi:hypothetical protein